MFTRFTFGTLWGILVTTTGEIFVRHYESLATIIIYVTACFTGTVFLSKFAHDNFKD